ncbi:uncharacterized protein KY384_002035 [Bacidia gigantensis]|uniref:uncharacterized protein n=1 Tax=Bacidia gigantensis TaxID=2732470 RepID=UPI001D03B753|nr:uncharacterized protein KY384_002035 [Bacidia gigantensis]KAG8533252.1 hypothetical protein KY384_002035 [Bacidia gigantensis]
MYAQPAPNTTNSSLVNGHLSPPRANAALSSAPDSDSESALSDVLDDSAILAPSPGARVRSIAENQSRSPLESLSSPGDDALGSEDPNFGDESPPAGTRSPSQNTRSTSEESPRQRKRKAGIEKDDFVMNDPELYGLRRSARPRPNRQFRGPPRKRRKPVPSISVNGQTPSGQSMSDQDSDVDDYGAPRRHLTKKQHRRPQPSTRDNTPNYGEVRFSTRKAAKISNYNEDDDDMLDDEEPQSWTYIDENTAPKIDCVLNHRMHEGIDKEITEPGKDDFEYYIKWENKAHYHATWETHAQLRDRLGYKKLDNYFKKVAQEDFFMSRDENIPLEEREKWNLDRERDTDALIDYVKIERVIGVRDGDDDTTEYFIKWKGLPYNMCTWEKGGLVSEIAQLEIDRYLNRTSSLPQSNKTESNPNTRSSFKRIAEQPSYIKNGTLREFQLHGLNFLAYNWCKSKNVILADEMGLGKTVQTVAFMNWLRNERGQQGPFIVIVPLSTVPSWAETLDYWTPDINYVVYYGNETARSIIIDHELLDTSNRPKFHVMLTTYEEALKDASFLSQIKWQFMAIDEAHRLKNRESQLYSKLLAFKAPNRLLITGTPMQNTLGELSSLMDFLMPGAVQIDEKMDLTSEAAGAKIDEMTKAVQPYMLRRTKNKVENDLPPKTEKIIRVELSDVQLEYYKNILTRNYTALNEGASGHKHTLLNIMMELKKASNHPFIFPSAEDKILNGSTSREDTLRSLITSSGKMMLLDQLLKKLRKDNHRVLIFSQMVMMLNILGDYLHLRNYQYQRLDGTISAAQRRMAIDHFNAPESNDFCFLLSTRAGGLGINLMTADTVILFDSDWNPQADLQAMARAHRIGQTKPVSIYRLVAKETVEEEVLERARNKLMLEFITIQRGVTDKDVEKRLSEKMARDHKKVEYAEPNSAEDISRILKRRGQKMFLQSGNQKKLEELDIDSVLENAEEHKTEQAEAIDADGGEEFLKSFEYTDVDMKELEWDSIIPKEQLDAIKAEEKHKADEQYLNNVIAQNAPRKRKADEERAERAAKKRARDLATVDSDDESDQQPGLDPSRPLNTKECRNLITAFLRFGLMDERKDEILQKARLTNRDYSVVKATIDEVFATATRLVKEEHDRLAALERSGKTITKKDRKAVLFDFRDAQRNNAEHIAERPGEMHMLMDEVAKFADPKSFRIPEASKPATYSCEWGAREDGMLCLGIVRHGDGSWAAIRDDPELGMQDKLFLEEHRVEKQQQRITGGEKGLKSPGAVHLVRRKDYLLSVLKEKTSRGTNLAAKRAVENHHRNNKKSSVQARLGDGHGSVSASPVPSSARKVHRDIDKHRHRSNAEGRISLAEANGYTPRQDRPRSHTENHHSPAGQQNHRRSNEPSGRDSTMDSLMWKIFKPVRENLKNIQNATKHNMQNRAERATTLRRELLEVGKHVESLASDEGGDLGNSFWEFVATYWPNPGTEAHVINSLFTRLMKEENTKNDSAGVNGKTSEHPNGQSNGATTPAAPSEVKPEVKQEVSESA